MKVTNMYNTDTNESYVLVESELLRRYYTNFLGLFMLGKKKTKALDSIILDRISENSVKIIISKNNKNDDKSPIGMILPFPTMTAMSIDGETINAIDDIINKFIEIAGKRKADTTEIVPLTGYDIKKIKSEVQSAVEMKRDLILIDSYQSWLNIMVEKKPCLEDTIKQYIIEYGTNEYADVVLSIFNNELNNLNESYKSKLEALAWF